LFEGQAHCIKYASDDYCQEKKSLCTMLYNEREISSDLRK